VEKMFQGSRAPWSRSEDRCDGAGCHFSYIERRQSNNCNCVRNKTNRVRQLKSHALTLSKTAALPTSIQAGMRLTCIAPLSS
jgi:hypothetical protein